MRKNKRILIFGRPGSGKTTLTVLEMISALSRGDYVYSNIKINWFGELFLMNPFFNFFNKCWSFVLKLTRQNRYKKYLRLTEEKTTLEQLRDNPGWEMWGNMRVPKVNLTNIFYRLYYINQALEKIARQEDDMIIGKKKPYYYAPDRYIYCPDLKEAVSKIIKHAINNPEAYFLLAFDEGFVELDFSNRVPNFITNFFNQTRKLNIDVIISSQRPVAVYPAYRALCDYMIWVQKTWFFGTYFQAKKYFVDDNANALPDLSKDAEGKDKGEHYKFWSGKEVFPFFDTRQSIGLDKLKEANRLIL